MSNKKAKEPKNILSKEQMMVKVENTIRFYQTSKKDVMELYSFISSLIDIHNEACLYGREMTWMTTFEASYPDH